MPSRIDLKKCQDCFGEIPSCFLFLFFPKWHDFHHSYFSCQNASNFVLFFQLGDIVGEKTANFLYLAGWVEAVVNTETFYTDILQGVGRNGRSA